MKPLKKLSFIGLTAIVLSLNGQGAQAQNPDADTAVFERFLQYAETGDRSIIHTARFFTGTPYVGGTLENDSVEQLQINLRKLDCVTFVENTVALHLMLQSDRRTFADFCRILQRIRYRGGIVDGYLSRLHYTSEWLDSNRQKGFISLPAMPACRSFAPGVSFMSTHCETYPALKAHPDRCKDIEAIEKNINKLNLCYIPKERVKTSGTNIRTGDIIAVTTHVKGLDIAHIGFALERNGNVYLLHASSEAKKVTVSDETLHDYLLRRKNHSGIIVARINQVIFD